MAQLSVIEEASVGAPADRVYSFIADMKNHHQHFLPPSFGEIRVEEGGYGAGTVYRVNVTFAGRTRELHMRVDEPEPGRVISEADLESPMVTTWTITPEGAARCHVRLETHWPSTGGFQGLLERLFAPGMMRKTYRDELARLDRYAREQAGK
jgi:ribosome-associated toxin RatA of RatAB toxin-antitoxin module